jgi:hypothetical protein
VRKRGVETGVIKPFACWGEPDPDGIYDGPLGAKTGRLSAVLVDAGRKTFNYIDDFGDGSSHTVKLEKLVPMIEGEPALFLLDAMGRCRARPILFRDRERCYHGD